MPEVRKVGEGFLRRARGHGLRRHCEQGESQAKRLCESLTLVRNFHSALVKVFRYLADGRDEAHQLLDVRLGEPERSRLALRAATIPIGIIDFGIRNTQVEAVAAVTTDKDHMVGVRRRVLRENRRNGPDRAQPSISRPWFGRAMALGVVR